MSQSRPVVVIINGPNLNLLGTREKDIYGDKSLADIIADLQRKFPEFDIVSFQSNIEGELIDAVQKYGFSALGIVLNPGGYTHTSVALRDAIAAIKTPVVEVHISNIHNREDFRRLSLLAPVCKGAVLGLGTYGYEAAVRSFL
jgi:3-dehydroquinate dehydratase II